MEVWRVIWLYIYISSDGHPPFQEPLLQSIHENSDIQGYVSS